MDGGAGESSAHAGATRVFLALMVNGEISENGGVLQTFDQRSILITTFCGIIAQYHVADRVNRHATGNVSGESSTHAIGDDKHETLVTKFEVAQIRGRGSAVTACPGLLFGEFEDEKIVLISASNATYIRFCMQLNNHTAREGVFWKRQNSLEF
jgi:hypothetical protein